MCTSKARVRRDDQVRYGEAPGQPLGGLEGGQRVRVPAARQLQHPAGVADRHCRRGLGFGSEGAFGAQDPRLGLLRPSLPGQQAPSVKQATPKAGSSVQPCRWASSIACLLLLGRHGDMTDRKSSLAA